jgi:hypothetical protein
MVTALVQIVLPQIPGGIDFARAVVLHEFEDVLRVGAGKEFAFQQER